MSLAILQELRWSLWSFTQIRGALVLYFSTKKIVFHKGTAQVILHYFFLTYSIQHILIKQGYYTDNLPSTVNSHNACSHRFTYHNYGSVYHLNTSLKRYWSIASPSLSGTGPFHLSYMLIINGILSIVSLWRWIKITSSNTIIYTLGDLKNFGVPTKIFYLLSSNLSTIF